MAVTLLLTLPGLPFVYYGEEIGMTGDKPDPRLRTPMHWTRGPAAGFTSGAAWEPLMPDSMTANVEAQDGDPASLLNLHRRLIHLRGTNEALGGGALVPVTASSDAVAAYVRRAGDAAVLVVANLGSTPLAGITVTSGDGALPSGSFTLVDLLDGTSAARLRVGANGRVQGYRPLPSLPPLHVYVFQLSRAR
jgi:glycosidase